MQMGHQKPKQIHKLHIKIKSCTSKDKINEMKICLHNGKKYLQIMYLLRG